MAHNHVHDGSCEHHHHHGPTSFGASEATQAAASEALRNHSHHPHPPSGPKPEPTVRFEEIESDFDRACVAAGNGQLDVLKEMIQSSVATIDGRDKNGNTLLHFATVQDRVEICEYLVDLRPELIIARNNENGHTPVHWAASAGALLSLHIFTKANPQCVHICDDAGLSTMHIAAQNDKIELMHYLAAKGLSVSVRDKQGNTAMHWAAIKASEQAMRYLIASGADITAQNDLGLSPMHYGAGLNHLVVVRNLSILGEQHNRNFSDLEAVRDNQNRSTRDVALSKGESHKHMVRLIDNNLQREQNSRRLSKWFPFLSTKRNKNIFLFLSPFMAFAALIFLLQGRFIYGVGLFLILAVLYPMLGNTLRDDPMASGPICAAIYHITCLFSFYTLQTGLPDEWAATSWCLVVSFMAIMLIVVQLIPMFSDANGGALLDRSTDCQRWLEDIEQHRVAKICPTCRVRRALRTKHCREDDTCISKFDHWCVWVFNSVGAGNHRSFLLMVTCVVIGSASLLIFCASAFFGHLASQQWDLIGVLTSYPLLFISFILGCLHFPWTAFLLKTQLDCILRNYTTNEAFHGVRNYEHFRGGKNPFDLGSSWRNFQDFISGNTYSDLYYLGGKQGVLDSVKVD